MENYIQVLISIDTQERARALQRVLLEARAAACVQILGPISSAYWWEGQIEEAQEWLCLAKTRRAAYQRLEELVNENHPYDLGHSHPRRQPQLSRLDRCRDRRLAPIA
jgi:periplasmic divalent cation tolerance protein